MDTRKLRELARDAQDARAEKDDTEALLVLDDILDEILADDEPEDDDESAPEPEDNELPA